MITFESKVNVINYRKMRSESGGL